MNEKLTEMIFILDKSGSMSGLEKDTIGGFNSLIEKQKKDEGDAIVTTVLFSDNVTTIHDSVDVKNVPVLTDKEYFTAGCTALFDAVGETISKISHKREMLKDEYIPAKTIMVITTDGMENASKEYTVDGVKKLIEAKKEEGWEFLFLGANIDAPEFAEQFGISRNRSVNYAYDSEGINLNFCAVDKTIHCLRAESCVKDNWADEIRENEKKSKRKKGV